MRLLDAVFPMTTTFRALTDHVILEALEERESRSAGGILIPATLAAQTNKYVRFRVVAAGPQCSEEKFADIPRPAVAPGQIVLVPTDKAVPCRVEGKEYFVTRYPEIAAIVSLE